MGGKITTRGLQKLDLQDATAAWSPLSYNEVDFVSLRVILYEQQTLFQKE